MTDPAAAPPAASQQTQPKKKKGSASPVQPGQSTGGHPLETPWTIWYSKKTAESSGTKNSQWEQHLKQLGTFTTVESFASYYSSIKRPNEWPVNSDIHIFRNDACPSWENFPEGGSWTLRMKKKHHLNGRLWEELIFACIGEAFDSPDVVGVVFSTRPKEDVLSLWHQSVKLKYAVGERLKHILQLEQNAMMEYKPNSLKIKEAKTAAEQAHPPSAQPNAPQTEVQPQENSTLEPK